MTMRLHLIDCRLQETAAIRLRSHGLLVAGAPPFSVRMLAWTTLVKRETANGFDSRNDGQPLFGLADTCRTLFSRSHAPRGNAALARRAKHPPAARADWIPTVWEPG